MYLREGTQLIALELTYLSLNGTVLFSSSASIQMVEVVERSLVSDKRRHF